MLSLTKHITCTEAHEYTTSQHVCIGIPEMFQMPTMESFEKLCSLNYTHALVAQTTAGWTEEDSALLIW